MAQEFEITEKKVQEEGFDQFWRRFSPYWPLLTLLLIICACGAWYYLQYKAPAYEATATLLIKDEKKGVDGPKMSEGLNQLADTKIVDNEIEVIASRKLMAEVVKNLHLYAPVYIQGRWRPELIYPSPLIIESQNPDALREAKRVDFSFTNNNSGIKLGQKIYPYDTWVQTEYGKLRFTRNKNSDSIRSTVDSAMDENAPIAIAGNDSVLVGQYFFQLQSAKKATKTFTDLVQASAANKLSSVINLRLADESPLRAEDVLNGLITSYDRAAIREKNILADSTMALLEERLKNVSTDLVNIEKKLQDYRSSKDAINIGSQGQLFLENVSENDRKASEVNMQLAALDQVEKYVSAKANGKSDIIPSTLLVSDPLLNQRIEKLNEAELEYEKIRKTTAENNPIVVSITNQIERLRSGLLESVKNQKASLKAGIATIASTNERYNKILQTVPEKERQLIEISREQTLKTNIYNYLAQKREEAALSNTAIISESRVVDNAQASFEPVSPNKLIAYGSALAAAIVLFIGLVLMREGLNRNVLYRHDIESNTVVPLVAEIPYQKGNKPLVVSDGETSFVAEQFRKLRSSLSYLGINEKRKIILVTSIIPGEGKSFVSANLALTLALAGKKVLLLEFDLVNPVLSEKFKINVQTGVASYLFGNTEPEEIIKRTEANENLFIIPAGYLPPNPSELIMSARTQQLLKYSAGIFDYVIVDTAPVGLRSDAYVISKYCDASLYVIRHKKTPKKSVKQIDENNKINQLKNMAIVFNAVTPKNFSSNYGSYGYDYKYNSKNKKRKRNLAGIG